MNERLNVVHLQRKPFPGYYSIEGQFAEIRGHLPADINCSPWICPHFSKGILRRMFNARAAAALNADVFHITGDVHYLTRFLPPHKTVLTVHDCVFLRQTSGLRRLFIRKLFYEWAVPRAAAITVISEATRRELLELVPGVASRVTLVPCCAAEDFTFDAPRPWPARPTVLMVGSTPNKNMVNMARALAGMPVRVHVVGRLDDSLREALTAGGLEWSNSPALDREQMRKAYRDCDLLGFASTYEGFGLPIVEAQATGRPVLTSNVSSMPEVSGGAAVLVDPADINSIRAGFAHLLEDAGLRADLVKRGLANARRFAPANVAAQYAALYRRVAAGVDAAKESGKLHAQGAQP